MKWRTEKKMVPSTQFGGGVNTYFMQCQAANQRKLTVFFSPEFGVWVENALDVHCSWILYAVFEMKIDNKQKYRFYCRLCFLLFIHCCAFSLFLVTGLNALVDRLETTSHPIIYFIFNGVNIRDLGYCDIAEQLSSSYGKRIIFWPCLQMKVSK